jgi:hypothetical protein
VTPASETDTETEAPPMLAVYRHDVHKLYGRSHEAARDEIAGTRVNETVPRGADADAALLSRPRGDPEQTLPAHGSPFRLSLLTGETATDHAQLDALADAARELIRIEDPHEAHEAWLTTDAAAAVNESQYYPYTSLKYHTLLAGALLANYRAGAAFEDLYLTVTDPAAEDDHPRPYRTICTTPAIALHLTDTPDGRPATRLGPRPARSFADVWARVPRHPVAVDSARRWRLLDAQLRRIRAWSTALQYIEEYCRVHAPTEAAR